MARWGGSEPRSSSSLSAKDARAEAERLLADAAPLAAEALVRILEDSRSATATVAAAKEVLERALGDSRRHQGDSEIDLSKIEA